MAENSSSVFYPAKLLFAAPASFDRLFHAFLAGHVLLAGYAMYRLARSWGQSTTAAGIAGVSYALSGGVLFQYCNPPFLIGAAWLPVAVGTSAALLKQRSISNACKVACVLAIMVLGGDSQTVYHIGLMMVLLAQLLWWNARNEPIQLGGLDGIDAAKTNSPTNRGFVNGLFWISMTALLAIGLAAIQILPTAQHTAASQRATHQVPRSLDELVADAVHGEPLEIGGLLGTASELRDDRHYRRAFAFSVGPWRWPELVLPNVSGKWFPINRRWIKSLPAEGRVWTPSLYLGLLPFCLAIGAIRARRSLSIEGRWIVWCTLLAALGSMGAYGLGWLLVDWHIYQGGTEATAPIGRPVGSLYWLMTVFLPAYIKFRYPAKLWTIATFGLSVLAGMEWDRRQKQPHAKTRSFFVLGGICILGLAAVWFFQATMKNAWSNAAITDTVFGPLDVELAWLDVAWALGQAALLCFVFGFVLSIQTWRRSNWLGPALILLVTADLLIAHHWMLPSAATNELGETPQIAANDNSQPPPRVYRSHSNWRPKSWSEKSSTDRVRDLVRWDRESLFPQHHIQTRQAVIDSQTTLPMRDWVQFLNTARQRAKNGANFDATLALLDCGHVVSMSRENSPGIDSRQVAGTARGWAMKVSSLKEVSDATELPPDFVIDAPCDVTYVSPHEITVSVDIREPALIVLSEYFHDDWRATARIIDSDQASAVPIERVFGILRGVQLKEPGEYAIRFSYRSKAFEIGAILSSVTWVLAMLILLINRRHSHQIV